VAWAAHMGKAGIRAGRRPPCLPSLAVAIVCHDRDAPGHLMIMSTMCNNTLYMANFSAHDLQSRRPCLTASRLIEEELVALYASPAVSAHRCRHIDLLYVHPTKLKRAECALQWPRGDGNHVRGPL